MDAYIIYKGAPNAYGRDGRDKGFIPTNFEIGRDW